MSDGILWGDLVKEYSGGFDPLPIGDYDVVVDSAESVLTKNGKNMIKVKFKVQGGPLNNRTVYWNAVFSPRRDDGSVNEGALKAWFSNMAAFGMKTEFFSTNPSFEQIADTMVGKHVVIKLGIREYMGEDQNDVKRVKAPEGGAIEVQGSGSSFGAPAAGRANAASPSPSIGGLPPAVAEPDDDDPF